MKKSYEVENGKKKIKVKQFKDEYLEKGMPKTYYVGLNEAIYNFKNLSLYMIYGAIQITIIFFCNYAVFKYAVLDASGITIGMWGMSVTFYTEIFIIASLKLTIYTRLWHLFN